MRYSRYKYVATVSNEFIYIAGGINEDYGVDLMERYNLRTGEWEEVAHGFDGPITMIGTKDYVYSIFCQLAFDKPLRLGRYDPSENLWTMVIY